MSLSIVGIGPGSADQITPQALAELRAAEVIVGYTRYVELVRPLFPHKEYHATGMRGEEERCRWAVEAAKAREVALIASGDAGVYGLAGLAIEMAREAGVDVRVAPGLTAALTGAALLGAPINHDFVVISLSDLLTPWTVIEKRLHAAAEGDFVVVLYNPMSHSRRTQLARACEILLEHRPAETPAGLARNIGREGEACRLTTLGELRDCEVDMFTTVFIGSSQTRTVGGWLVTPRGYRWEDGQ